MTTKKTDDAISPVIGVMLMVVITVVIAAVITAFATGVVGETEVAPVAVLDVEIHSSTDSLPSLNGPELFITHRSGDAVDTGNIELRFSWTCDDGCSHHSTYSAKGCAKEHPNGISSLNGMRSQALYLKSTMAVQSNEYGSTNLNHYFGDVTLTPGLKLTATSDTLPYTAYNTGSQFMDIIFDNYQITSTGESVSLGYNPAGPGSHDDNTCDKCAFLGAGNCGRALFISYVENTLGGNPDEYCYNCYVKGQEDTTIHPISECNENGGHDCECIQTAEIKAGGIMEHLEPGTEVDVMIVHMPSGKAIYDKTVIVQ